MPSLQEAMRDAGLTSDLPRPATGVLTVQVRTAVLDAPASHLGMQHTHHPVAYDGARWNMDRFADESISLGPAEPRQASPDDSPARIREIAQSRRGDLAHTLAGYSPAVIARAMELAQRSTTCSTCNMQIPAGHKSCPDC